MNLFVLKKLIELANHNTNEYEAMQAARKVCEMLDGVSFIDEAKPIPEGRSLRYTMSKNQMEYIERLRKKNAKV
jgi:hypothetical protein